MFVCVCVCVCICMVDLHRSVKYGLFQKIGESDEYSMFVCVCVCVYVCLLCVSVCAQARARVYVCLYVCVY